MAKLRLPVALLLLVAIHATALVTTGCQRQATGGDATSPPQVRRVVVQGKYWSSYFSGPSRDPSMGNFMLFGIFPCQFLADGAFRSEDFGNGTWTLEPGGLVVLTRDHEPPMTFQAQDGGDVLVAKRGIHWGMEDNHLRLLRDNPDRKQRLLGRYVVAEAGSAAKELPQSMTFTEQKVTAGNVSGDWIAAGDYVVLIGRHDTAYMYPSFVFRVEEEGRKLVFHPSDPYPEFRDGKWDLVYVKTQD
ncbi:MAG: hypothetical protein M9921_05745 [Fimbriimonadaceae bacterium]|nr:hypothetical protein [Chthonomonadaceae bacterium]MCO5296343.1 hypothetical protein [Fimbriimonadaceae bacterium]